MTDAEDGPERVEEVGEEHSDEGTRADRRVLRVLGYLFIGLAVLIAIYGTIFFVAWDRGQVQRAQDEQTALDSELEKQMNLAGEESATGNDDLALRRLEWILERDPNYPGVSLLMERVLSNLDKPATPTPMLRETGHAAVTGTPSTGPGPAEAFATLEQIMDREEWEQAITAITAFQTQYPDYQRQRTDSLLYDAYVNLGQLLVMGDQVELGLFYFDQAEKLGDLPIEAEDQRTWADLYLLGISYYGVDWGTAIFYFRGLCAAAPFYHDACVKLHEVLIAYADQYALNLDYCPAEALYSEANQLSSDKALIEKVQAARDQCLEATPTPTVSPTVPVSGTETIESSLPVTIVAGS
jgi:hypothetical protein